MRVFDTTYCHLMLFETLCCHKKDAGHPICWTAGSTEQQRDRNALKTRPSEGRRLVVVHGLLLRGQERVVRAVVVVRLDDEERRLALRVRLARRGLRTRRQVRHGAT